MVGALVLVSVRVRVRPISRVAASSTTRSGVACHGPDGNLIADHKLGTLKARRDADDTIRYIKDPKAPMPKMFPDLIDEQAVVDVTAYVRDELGKTSP